MALSLIQEPPAPSFPPSLATPITAKSKLKASSLFTSRAQLQDARAIHRLIESFTGDNTLLHRSYAEICENIQTFTIVETGAGQFAGCAALHVYGEHLAEIRSVVVNPEVKNQGAGSMLVRALLDQAEARGIKCVCLFTRIPAFFEHFRFHVVEHRALRDKVMKDCMHCARRNACDEIAMAIGELPAHTNLPAGNLIYPQHLADLVQLRL
jgi:amino-acid N-acetyltransferase